MDPWSHPDSQQRVNLRCKSSPESELSHISNNCSCHMCGKKGHIFARHCPKERIPELVAATSRVVCDQLGRVQLKGMEKHEKRRKARETSSRLPVLQG